MAEHRYSDRKSLFPYSRTVQNDLNEPTACDYDSLGSNEIVVWHYYAGPATMGTLKYEKRYVLHDCNPDICVEPKCKTGYEHINHPNPTHVGMGDILPDLTKRYVHTGIWLYRATTDQLTCIQRIVLNDQGLLEHDNIYAFDPRYDNDNLL